MDVERADGSDGCERAGNKMNKSVGTTRIASRRRGLVANTVMESKRGITSKMNSVTKFKPLF